MQPTNDTTNDPGLEAIRNYREGRARLEYQMTIADNGRGYNPESIALTCEQYGLTNNDVYLASLKITRERNEQK